MTDRQIINDMDFQGTFHPKNVVDPTADQDAATKKYVDDTAGGGFVPDPSGEPDDRWLKTSGGALIYTGAPSGVTFGTPAIVLGTAAAAGSISEAIKRDATIVAFDATVPTTQAFGDSAATGSAAVAARRDHKHAMPANPSDASISVTDITTNDATTSAHGFLKKLPGGTTTFLRADGSFATPSGTGAATLGASALVYRYTVTGSDKASIDTGVDTADAGSNDWTNGDLLEIFVYARTDESAVASQLQFIFNNDTTSIYDTTRLTGQNSGVSSASFANLGRFLSNASGASATASIFSATAIRVPNYAGTVAFKVGDLVESLPEPSTSAMENQVFTFGYRSASAISRFKVIPNTSGKKLKVGTQLLIYKRLAS